MGEGSEEVQNFGCSFCWPSSAEAAYACKDWKAQTFLRDESHFIVRIYRCAKCNQPFISVFTETIDWTGGQDPHYRTIMPLLEAEVLALSASPSIEGLLNSLAPQRRSLQFDWPKGKDKAIYWSKGIPIGPRD